MEVNGTNLTEDQIGCLFRWRAILMGKKGYGKYNPLGLLSKERP
jgi:hypothetical protein